MRAKILIVEDELYTGEALKILLEELDYEVLDIVTSGEEAIEKIRESPPDLILMDIMLDGQMTGIEAAQEINGTYEIPVIFLTAYGDFKTIQKAKLCSPYGYLVKPITEATELQPSIELALFNHKEKQQLRKQSIMLREIQSIVKLEPTMGNSGVTDKNQTTESKDLSFPQFEKIFSTLASEERLQILWILRKRKLSFEEIHENLDKNAISTTSHHLAMLEKQDFIFGTRDGRKSIFELKDHQKLIEFLQERGIAPSSEIFSCLNSKERLLILQTLKIRPLISQDLEPILEKSPSTIAHHLRTLLECGFLSTNRRGRNTEYELVNERMEPIYPLLMELGNHLK